MVAGGSFSVGRHPAKKHAFFYKRSWKIATRFAPITAITIPTNTWYTITKQIHGSVLLFVTSARNISPCGLCSPNIARTSPEYCRQRVYCQYSPLCQLWPVLSAFRPHLHPFVGIPLRSLGVGNKAATQIPVRLNVCGEEHQRHLSTFMFMQQQHHTTTHTVAEESVTFCIG